METSDVPQFPAGLTVHAELVVEVDVYGLLKNPPGCIAPVWDARSPESNEYGMTRGTYEQSQPASVLSPSQPSVHLGDSPTQPLQESKED